MRDGRDGMHGTEGQIPAAQQPRRRRQPRLLLHAWQRLHQVCMMQWFWGLGPSSVAICYCHKPRFQNSRGSHYYCICYWHYLEPPDGLGFGVKTYLEGTLRSRHIHRGHRCTFRRHYPKCVATFTNMVLLGDIKMSLYGLVFDQRDGCSAQQPTAWASVPASGAVFTQTADVNC